MLGTSRSQQRLVNWLIVLVLVIGAALGWTVRRAHLQRDAVVAIEKAGGQVDYAIFPGAGDFSWTKPLSWNKLIGEYIGIDLVDHVAYVQFLERSNSNDAPRRQAQGRPADLLPRARRRPALGRCPHAALIATARVMSS